MAASNSSARNLSIKGKLTFIIMLTSGAALLMACLGFALYDYYTFRQEKVRELGSFAEIIAASSAKALSQEEAGSLADLADVFGSLPSDRNVLAACLYSRKGQLLSGYVSGEDETSTCPSTSPVHGHLFLDSRLQLAQSVVFAGLPVGTVYLESGLDGLLIRMRRYATISGIVLMASFLFAFLLSARLRKVISDPILRLAETARSISSNQDYSVRVRRQAGDEVGTLTDAFNDMLEQIEIRDDELRDARDGLQRRVEERTSQLQQETSSRQQAEEALKESEEQLRQSQKMEAVGRLAGGVAHDFNNLLTAVMGYTDMMVGGLNDSDPMKAQIGEIRKATRRAADLVRQLLAFSRRQVLEPKVMNLNWTLSSLEKMMCRLIGEHIEMVVVQGEGLGRIKADPGQVEQVILNLAVNARDAMPDGGRLAIETANIEINPNGDGSPTWAPPGSYVMLQVSDTGCGMDEETRTKIFEPFYTTKEQGEGTGLGLSTVYGIVTQSGGQISVQSEPGQGTSFRVLFPLVEAEAEPVEPQEPVEPVVKAAHGSETILLVEDEDLVRDLTRGILLMHGYKVVEARHGGEALVLCESHQGPIHLLLSDVVMPNLSGPDLFRRVSSLRPEMCVLFMSGYTDAVGQGRVSPHDPFIQKPFTPGALAKKVREVLDQYGRRSTAAVTADEAPAPGGAPGADPVEPVIEEPVAVGAAVGAAVVEPVPRQEQEGEELPVLSLDLPDEL